jgi:flagellar basal-body rod protein FlgF
MDRMLYIAMSGAKQTMLAQAVVSNNLANANSTAFRADLAAFRAMPVYGEGAPTRVYAMAERAATDVAPGVIQSTGRELDMAIEGEGWFAVQARDGNEAYTRAGDLRIAAGGMLVTGAGHPVLGNGGPIVIPAAEKIEIGVDGTISIQPVGQAASALAVVDRIKLVRPDAAELVKGDDGLMRAQDGTPFDADANVSLTSGALETSNVNTVEALVQQITLARQFELQVKLMRTAAENDAATTQMMKLS